MDPHGQDSDDEHASGTEAYLGAPFAPTVSDKFVINVNSPTAHRPQVITLRVTDDFFVAVAQLPYKPDEEGKLTIPCWCFSTYGLNRYDTKEVCLVLACLPDEHSIPDHVLRYLTLLYAHAKRGEKVSEGSFTRLAGDPFLGYTDIAGFVHVRARPTHIIDSLVVPSVPYLFAILVKTEEQCWVEYRQCHRLLLKLGHQYKFYPFPLWCARDRKPVYTGFHDSVLASNGSPCIRDIVTHVDNADKVVNMYLPKSRHSEMLAVLKQIPLNEKTSFTFLTDISDVADGHMVFTPEQERPQYSMKPGRKPTIIGMSFLVIAVPPKNLPVKPNSGANHIEDGVLTVVRQDQMKGFYEALEKRTDWSMKSDGFPLLGLSVKWVDRPLNEFTKEWSSPIDGVSAAKLKAQNRSIIASETQMGPQNGVILSDIVLISSEREVRASGISESQLDDLKIVVSEAVVELLNPFWKSSDLAGIEKIGLRIFLKSEFSHGIYSCGARPEKLPLKCSQALRQGLFKIEFPKVRKPLSMEMTFRVTERPLDSE